MTQLTLSMLLKAEGAPAAKAAIQDVAKSTDALGTATTKGAAADRAAAAAKQSNAQASRVLTTENRAAAAATGNLVAQFNDIFMMIGSGQNPLVTAIQQGSQITQSFGNAGAAGAAKTLGGAFVAMLNPINLIIPAVIAASGYMIQWLLTSDEKASKLAGALEDIRAATEKTQGEIDKLKFGVDEEYQVQLLKEQIQLRSEYNLKVAELQGYLGSTTESIDLQRIKTAELRSEIGQIVGRYNEISASLSDQQNRSAQLAVLKGIEAQRAGEVAARQREAEQAAAALQAKVQAIVSSLASVNGSRLVSAFQSAFPAASQLLGMAQNIIATIGSASAQAAAMNSAETSGLAAQYNLYGQGRVAGERAARESGSLYGGRRVIPLPGGGGGGGGGGGAGAAAAEANALQDLIKSLEGEIEALRTQDPIQKEMLKNREALKGATEAEKKKVEELIATREREQILMEGAKARASFFEDLGNNALEALIVKGESFNDVLKNIAQSLIQAGIQAALFGSGPFGSLFGGKSILSGLFGGGGGGGGLGSLLGGGDLFGGLATGGMVTGPGTGTSDSIPTMLSNGEFVINARATARNRHLLEAINAGGSVQRYASGGYVGSDSRRMTARGGSDLPATIYLDMRGVQGDREIEAIARRSAAQVVAMYDKEGLPVSIQRVRGDPRRQG